MRRALMIMWFAVAAGCFVLPGKAHAEGNGPVADDSITYSTGACLGTCPVFSVTVTPRGGMFHGSAFTARTGDHAFPITSDQYRRFAETLAPYRPQGDRRVDDPNADCGPARTDYPSVDVSWGGKDHLSLYYGCENPALQKMKEALIQAEDSLPIADLIGHR